MTVNYSIIDNLCRQAQILNEDELKIFLSKLDPAAKEHLQTEIFNSLSHNINDGVEYCPHCGSIRVNKYGSFHGSQRYKCRDCKKTFTNTKNSMFFHFRKDYEQKFKKYIECMVNKLSLHRSEEVCDISYRCSFVWRHKILAVITKFAENDKITGLVECDDTYFSKCFKGNHKHFQLPRKARVRGFAHWVGDSPGVSQDKVCLSTAVGRNKSIVNGILGYGNPSSGAIWNLYHNKIECVEKTMFIVDGWKGYIPFARTMGLELKRLVMPNRKENDHSPVVRGKYHLQNVNNYHSQIKHIINDHYKGVATKYLLVYVNFVKWLRINNQGFNISVQSMLNICLRTVHK